MATVIYFMPYDPNQITINSAHMEYRATGFTPPGATKAIGTYKNMVCAADEALHGNTAAGVWWDGTGHSTQLQANYPGDTRIMIRGHGMPGCDIIEGGRGGEKVSWKEVAHRLFSSGLKTSYSGSIIAYSCHSGESYDNIPAGYLTNGKPFAQNLAEYMTLLGYKSCTYFGYLGAIDSFAKDGDQGKTTYSRAGGDVLGTSAMATVQFHT